MTLRTAYRVNRIAPGAGDQVEQVLTDFSAATGVGWWLTEHEGVTTVRCAWMQMPWETAVRLLDGAVELSDIDSPGETVGASTLRQAFEWTVRNPPPPHIARANGRIIRDDPGRAKMIPDRVRP